MLEQGNSAVFTQGVSVEPKNPKKLNGKLPRGLKSLTCRKLLLICHILIP